ncbi:UDP-3-O-(3-hydroxymyristoyl)glucosamine N-acyltransferase, partial [Eudoraea sp.]
AQYGDDFYLGAFSYLGNNVKIGDNVKIYPNVYVGDNVKIGDNVVVFAGAKIYSETEIGHGCIIHSGAIIGADGFGYTPNDEGVYSKVPQTGNVVLEANVDVGAGTTIDRATLGSTILRKGVKLDNQIQIAHNVEIGEHTVIAAQTGIAGSTKIGKHCLIGGQVGIAGHIIIGDRVRIQAQSGIGRNIKDGEVLQGSPAFSYSDYSRSYVHFKNLPKLVNKLNDIQKQQDQ